MNFLQNTYHYVDYNKHMNKEHIEMYQNMYEN